MISATTAGRIDRRNLYIDALRGVSILLVVVFHVQIRVPLQDSLPFRHAPGIVWQFVCRNGNNGVRMFFVISGFLITLTSLARWGALERIDARHFYWLRFTRIAPPLLALLAVLSVLHVLQLPDYAIDPRKASLERAVLSALGLHLNWLEAKVGYLPASWDVLWSLSVEEAFYLFFPLACLSFRWRLGGRALLVLLIVAGPFVRALEPNPIWRSKAYLACVDAIALGCLTALIAHDRAIAGRARLLLLLLGCTSTAAMLSFDRQPVFSALERYGLTKTLLSLGVAALLVAASGADVPQWAARWLRPLTACGRLSYEIYLTHAFIVLAAVTMYRTRNLAGDAAAPMLALVLGLCWALGALVERYFSTPSNRRLRALAAPRTSNSTAAGRQTSSAK